MDEATVRERALAARLLDERERHALVALLVAETEIAAAEKVGVSVRQFQRILDDIRLKLGAHSLFALGAEAERLGLIDWAAVKRERGDFQPLAFRPTGTG